MSARQLSNYLRALTYDTGIQQYNDFADGNGEPVVEYPPGKEWKRKVVVNFESFVSHYIRTYRNTQPANVEMLQNEEAHMTVDQLRQLTAICDKAVRTFLRKNRNNLFSSLDAGLLHLPSVAPFYKKVSDMMEDTERELIAKVTEFYRARRPPLASRSTGRPSSTYESVSTGGRENNERLLSAHMNRRRPGEEARHITERGFGVGWYG